MRQRPRLIFAALLFASLVGAFGATGSISPTDAEPAMSDGAFAVGAGLLSSEVAALRNQVGGAGERWLGQSSSKGRSLSLAATLAVALGALSLLPRLHGRRPLLNSSTLTLRRHSVALRAPPSTPLA